jgi:3-hydroxyisobutyrate dehydrogenase-like beta-hydroxyacid dehydrogenase
VASRIVGFVGLGNMGAVLATNLAAAGFEVLAHDAAGPARAPEGVEHVASVAQLADRAETLVLSLPDGAVSASVAAEVLAAPARRCRLVIDTSTVGLAASTAIGEQLATGGVAYVDAPVSGGPAGARARTLMVMYSCSDEAASEALPVLEGLSDRRQRVGERPGLAQAVKLANNFLSATALAATSEAVAFAVSVGVDMATVLEVLNSASGQSAATLDKFPNHVLTARYGSGFSNSLMSKDIQLYLSAVESQGAPDEFGALTAQVWRRFADEEPGADFTRIYPFVEGS